MLVKKIHNRGANIVVEANGEVLFAPTGDVGRWMNRFSRKVKGFAEGYAPINKRPRWGHYGKPLKDTFTASTRYAAARMKVYSAIGSSAPHAWYVDQGTGVFGGSGPYPAKVLPPWTRGSASLYEHTWIPGGPPGKRVSPVMIKGQKGQGFFDKGLKRGFEFMRMRAFQVPDEGKITKALSSFPAGLANFAGNTPADAGFRASLTEWRAWRDAAFNRSEELGKGHKPGRTRSMAAAQRAVVARAAQSRSAAAAARRQANTATKAAADHRAKVQKSKLLAEKARKAKGREAREERERVTRLNANHNRARAQGQRLRNNGATGVRLSAVFNAAHTVLLGYDLYWTDASNHNHVKHYR